MAADPNNKMAINAKKKWPINKTATDPNNKTITNPNKNPTVTKYYKIFKIRALKSPIFLPYFIIL